MENDMTKLEFLDKLRDALTGRLSSGQIMENVRFYEDYINTEIRKGRSEEEVLVSLGDPRLIARTIVETRGGSREGAAENSGRAAAQNFGMGRELETKRRLQGGAGVPIWIWLILAILILILVLSAVFSFISAILPIILPIMLVLFFVKVFRDWMN